MWTLLKYDLQKCRKPLYIISIIYIVVCGMILLFRMDDNLNSSLFFFGSALLIIVMSVMFLGFIVIVSSAFPSRFMKDSIVMLAPISKKTKVLEPLVVVVLIAVAAVIMNFVAYIFGGEAILNSFESLYPNMSVDEPVLMFVNLFLSYFSLAFFFISVIMFVWSVMRKRELKNPSHYTYAYYIALGATIFFTYVMKYIGYPVSDSPVLIILISGILYAICYYLFVYR